VGVLTGLIWLRTGIMAGSYEHSNETLGIIKGREFLDLLNECCLIHGVS